MASFCCLRGAQIELQLAGCGLPVELRAGELVPPADAIEELREECIELLALRDRARSRRIGSSRSLSSSARSAHERVEARVVRGAEQRVTHGA